MLSVFHHDELNSLFKEPSLIFLDFGLYIFVHLFALLLILYSVVMHPDFSQHSTNYLWIRILLNPNSVLLLLLDFTY